MRKIYGSSGKIYELNEELVRGGEGIIYTVANDDSILAKIYHNIVIEHFQNLECKLKTMLNMNIMHRENDKILLAWPVDILYENDQLIGFIMPKIQSNCNIHDLQNENKTPPEKYPHITWRFLVKCAYNLSQLVEYVHSNNIIIGDFNSKNILVNVMTGDISLVDCDSFVITDPITKNHFPCRGIVHDIAAPELQSPEWKSKILPFNNSDTTRQVPFSKESDYFSLAIHIFRLLMKNVHPFDYKDDSTQNILASPSSRSLSITNGNCPYVRKIQGGSLPAEFPAFNILPQKIQHLFRKTFDYNPETQVKQISRRTTANEWSGALKKLCLAGSEKYLKLCSANDNHIYPKHNSACPWCKYDAHKKAVADKVAIPSPSTASPHVNYSMPMPVHNMPMPNHSMPMPAHNMPMPAHNMPMPNYTQQVPFQKNEYDSQFRPTKVNFTVTAPKKLSHEENRIIHLIAFEDEYQNIVNKIIKAQDLPQAEMPFAFANISNNSVIKVILNSPDYDMLFEEEQVWQGRYIDFSIPVKLPEDYSKKQVLFEAIVYVNNIITSRISFTVKCGALKTQKINVTRKDISSAFISYASEDRKRVAMVIQGIRKARPDMSIFFDVETLRSGDDWEEKIHQEIENADILYLFWSTHARQSKWVDYEWRHSYMINGENGIEPIPLEPASQCPPPEELHKKHFNDALLYIIGDGGTIREGDTIGDDESTTLLLNCPDVEKQPVKNGNILQEEEKNIVFDKDFFIMKMSELKELLKIGLYTPEEFEVDRKALLKKYREQQVFIDKLK